MLRKSLVLLPIAFLTLWSAWAQEGMPSQAEMEAMMKAAAPGDQHQELATHAGKWKTKMTMWIPGMDAAESEGTAEAEMILGGRFLMSKQMGSTMGMPYEGLAIVGYDNVTKKYTHTWRSTMETSVTLGEGTADEQGLITLKGEMIDPMGGPMVPYRYEIKKVDDNHYVHTMYWSFGGQEAKAFEAHYNRVTATTN